MHVLAGWSARRHHIPWVLREQSSLAAYESAWKLSLLSRIGKKADLIVANSRGGERMWRELGRLDGCVLVANGFRSTQAVSDHENGRTHSPTSERFASERVILSAGRLVRTKRVDLLLQAFEQLGGIPSVRLVICGDGPERGSLMKTAGSLSCRERVAFVGHLDDLGPVLSGSAAFVSFSAVEGSPNTVVEAMLAGCPVVASDIEAHRELLGADCGVLVRETDPTAIAASLRVILDHPEEGAKMASLAKARAQLLSADRMVDAYERIYETVASNGRRDGFHRPG